MREGSALYGPLERGGLLVTARGQYGLPTAPICMTESGPSPSPEGKGCLKTIGWFWVGREVMTVTSGDAARLF